MNPKWQVPKLTDRAWSRNQMWGCTILMGRKFRHLQNSAATWHDMQKKSSANNLHSKIKVCSQSKSTKAGNQQITCARLLDVGDDSITAPPRELRILHTTLRSCDVFPKYLIMILILPDSILNFAFLADRVLLHSTYSLEGLRRLKNDVQRHDLQCGQRWPELLTSSLVQTSLNSDSTSSAGQIGLGKKKKKLISIFCYTVPCWHRRFHTCVCVLRFMHLPLVRDLVNDALSHPNLPIGRSKPQLGPICLHDICLCEARVIYSLGRKRGCKGGLVAHDHHDLTAERTCFRAETCSTKYELVVSSEATTRVKRATFHERVQRSGELCLHTEVWTSLTWTQGM